MKALLGYIAFFMVLCTAPVAFAEVTGRSITVSGEARDQIAPDQAILSMSLLSRDKLLDVAKKNNDQMIEKLVKIVSGFDIAKEKINTSNVHISPEYSYVNNKREMQGYMVSRSFRVIIDKLGVQERLLSAIVDAKIDQVNGMEFRLADPERYADVLRVKAFQNAKEKANILAKAAGAKLGAALIITTDGNNTPIPAPQPVMMRAAMADGAEMSVAPSLPGMVELYQSVNVTFALE